MAQHLEVKDVDECTTSVLSNGSTISNDASFAAQEELCRKSESEKVDIYGDLSPTGRLTSPCGEQIIILGNQKFLRSDLMELFGVAETPRQKTPKIGGNPAPLGLASFALTTFILSLINVGACGVHVPAILVGMGFWVGGVLQIIAGVWEMLQNNTFGAVAFSCYGGFWMAFSTMNTPGFGIASQYKGKEDQLQNGTAFFLLSWAIFSAMLTLCTMKSTVPFFMLFLVLTINFSLLTVGEFTGMGAFKIAGGFCGILDAFIAWYLSFCALATPDASYITFTPSKLPGNPDIV